MIILGDWASPTVESTEVISDFICKNNEMFQNQISLCNLEGVFNDDLSYLKIKRAILFNHTSNIELFHKINLKVATLANNHVFDLPDKIESTVSILEKSNIHVSGFGLSSEDACKPIIVQDKGVKVHVISACWDFMLRHVSNDGRKLINTIDEKKLLRQVKEIRENDKDARILLYFHWSFDLEKLPFPMYRSFSRDLIDAGANLVIGSHSHCIQGGEKYKEGYIFYGLGNFFIPFNVFSNGTLKYPPFCEKSLAVDWNPLTNSVVLHWLKYEFTDGTHSLKKVLSEDFENSEELKKYSPFQKLSDTAYLKYFKINKLGKRTLPTFTSYKSRLSYYYCYYLSVLNFKYLYRLSSILNFAK